MRLFEDEKIMPEVSFTGELPIDCVPVPSHRTGLSLAAEDSLSVSGETLWEIVERSAFLEERLGVDFVPETHAENSEEIENRMSAWRQNCARGDENVFAKRLQWDGLDAGRARRLVERVQRATPFGELPPWARLLRHMIEWSQEPWDETLLKYDLAPNRGEQPVAFEEFLYPFLGSPEKHSRRRLGPPIPCWRGRRIGGWSGPCCFHGRRWRERLWISNSRLSALRARLPPT